jgi:phosphatidate cytidylyltransferase
VRLLHDVAFQRLLEGVVGLLVVATIVGRLLALRVKSESGRETIGNLNRRVNAWWAMCVVFGIAVLTGGLGTYILFTLVSFLALREFVSLAPTRPSDHKALFWAFFLVTPLQYILIATKWYGMFVIMIPVYAFLLITIRIVLTSDTERFLERAAAIQWALMLCVYCLSYAPAVLTLEFRGYDSPGPKLLLFLVIVVQSSDVAQYIFGKLFGRHRIAPAVSPNKTWEGFVGGVIVSTALGAAIYWATPFTLVAAAGLALLVSLMGFCGGLVMSAIKRDRGVKDFGTLISGHGGVLDRVDSLMFAAPVFFHFSRFFFGIH